GNRARLYGGNKLRRAVFYNLSSTRNRADAYVHHLGRALPRHANWHVFNRVPIVSLLESLKLLRHHSPLAFAQVSPLEIQAHHKGKRVIAVKIRDRVFYSAVARSHVPV